jgi:hypothetical protein
MKIDLPITIIFDCQDYGAVSGYQRKNFLPYVCTLRFDSEDENAPVELFNNYPPEEAPGYPSCENGDALLTVISIHDFQRIVARAKRNPFDYGVGTEAERTIMQEEADEEAAQDGQFGAGA